jgi:hypothetical protein
MGCFLAGSAQNTPFAPKLLGGQRREQDPEQSRFVVAQPRVNLMQNGLPTLALIDETRRRLSVYSDRYKIVTHLSQKPGRSTIFVFTAKRAVSHDSFGSVEFFVIDEFHKLDALDENASRTVALNQAFYKLRKRGGQFYLLGPSIQKIPDGIENASRCYFYPTTYTTVVSEQTRVPGRARDDLERSVSLCKTLSEPTLIFCKPPARVNEVARALRAASTNASTSS